jgi:hypothetical protein
MNIKFFISIQMKKLVLWFYKSLVHWVGKLELDVLIGGLHVIYLADMGSRILEGKLYIK